MTQVPEKDPFHMIVEHSGQELPAADVGKMPFVSQYPSLEHIGVSSDLQHVYIVIGFQKDHVRIPEAFHRIVRIASQIGADTCFLPAVADPVSHGICRVVGNSHGVYLHILYGYLLVRADHNKPVGIDIFEFIHPFDRFDRSPGGVDRHLGFLRDHGKSVDMIGMLMGDKNTVYISQLKIQVFEGFHCSLPADPHVHQKMRGV